LLGFIAQIWQEKMYLKYHGKKGHEARLFTACIAAFLFPVGEQSIRRTSLQRIEDFIEVALYMLGHSNQMSLGWLLASVWLCSASLYMPSFCQLLLTLQMC
jgi:hypothetical protein